MTVMEILAVLNTLPGDMRVIVGSDEEGNDFVNPFTPEVLWCAEDDSTCGYRPVNDADVGTEYDQKDLVRMVVL